VSLDLNEIFKDRSWWEMPREDDGMNTDLANKVVKQCQDIERRQSSIFEGNRRHARIYSGYLPQGMSWGASSQGAPRAPFEATKAVIRSVCDTATALIVRSRPKASFVTDGADWETQLLAEDLDQFTVAQYQQGKLYDVAPRVFHDTTVFGTGAWKYVARGKGKNFRLSYERVLMDDLVIDEDECRDHLEPQNVYHRIVVRKEAVIKKYASGDSIRDRLLRGHIGANPQVKGWPGRYVPDGCIVIVEATHVDPEGKSRRVLACEGAVLSDTVWPFDFHPYTFLWWAPPISGFYGDGIAYRQYGRQQRITYMYRWIQRCHDIFATPRAWVDPAGGVPTMQMSNEIGQVIMARRPPTFEQKQVIPPEVYRWLDELERGGYEDEGISQVSANNQLPPGLESAPAQREYSFKEGQRFAPVSQRWENAIAVECAYKTIEFFRQNAKSSQERPTVTWSNRTFVSQIEWPDLKDQVFVIRPEASSLDALSPSARTQSALELAQTGWITPAEGRALVSHPDLRESDDLGNAGITYAKMVLKLLRKGEHVAVDEYADLVALDDVVRKGRLLAVQRSAPQKIIDNMSRYLDELDALKQQIQMAMQAQMAGAMPGAEGGAPGAPPIPGIAQASINNPVPAPFSG
jgi:hypothetical protein